MWRSAWAGLAGALVHGLLLAAAARGDGPGLLHPLFSDHGVIQRGLPFAVYGHARAGSDVDIALGPHTVRARAGDDGRWRAELPSLPAGGPFALTVSSEDRTQTVSDLMMGDVWLCSGQSNMVLEISRALDAPAEIGAAADPMIRALTLPQHAAAEPVRDSLSGARWQRVTPDNAGHLSAACYFMARSLREAHDVPVGLIVSAWGGSSITAWMREDALEQAGADPETLAMLALYRADPPAAMRRWGQRWEDWWLSHADDAPWTDDLDVSQWHIVPAFTYWEEWGDPELAAHDGMVWYRTTFDLTAGQAAQGAVLHLGRADEVDQSWVNGVPVGAMANPALVRAYELPPGRLREGRNTLTVNVLDTWRYGGLVGPDDRRALALADGTEIPLHGEWRYRRVDPRFAHPPSPPWADTGGFSQLAHGMIAPLEGYNLAGVAWYQGESDTRDGYGYRALLEGLISDWRARFRPGLPFLVVQLAGFGPHAAEPGDNGWADLRESQRRVALADPFTVIVPAQDLGEIHDIHPPNKQEVGRRLALAARHLVHGEITIAPSGPMISDVGRQDGTLSATFDGVTGALTVLGSNRVIGFELCGPDGCRYADAHLTGPNRIRIEDLRRDDARLRFCWAMNPLCNLLDGSGRPPPPFEHALAE